MNVTLMGSKPAGAEGIVHKLRVDSSTLGVRVRLLGDGRWLVRIEAGDHAGGIADHPLDAFRVARELADRQARSRGLTLPWSEIEDVLCAACAFDVEVPLDFSLGEWRAIGLTVAHPNLPEAQAIEAELSSSAFVRQAFGVGDGPWRVVGARWEDFGRRMIVGLHFGVAEDR